MKKMFCKPASGITQETGIKPTNPATKKKPKTKKPASDQSTSGITGSFFALEPRIMFDGAAVATGAEVLQDTTTQDQTEIPGIDGETTTDSTSTDSSDSEALWSSGLSLSAPSDRKEIVFIDTRVEDYQTLMEGIDPNAEVILLDSTREGVEQIAEALNGRTDIDAIHLISHGTEGVLNLGTSALTLDTMMGEYADELSLIKQTLSEEADLLIYGCNFAQGDSGQAAVTLLAELTGADVAASTDKTGAQNLGGDWELEAQTGSIETNLVVNETIQGEWNSLLAETWRDAATGAIISGPSSGDQIFIGDSANNSPSAAGGGNDTMYGGAGDDTFYGGSGNDVLIGGEGNDTLTGDSGDDVILGGAGNDQLFGGSATTANVLISGGGNDTMTGGTGSDIFRFTGAQSGDVITVNGDAGTDTIDLSEFASATITDNGSTITVDRGGGDIFTINYSNIETIITSASGGNHGPVAEAGPDQTVATSSLVTLTAAGSSDQDGDTLTYQWIQIEGDTWVTLNNGNTATPTFTAPASTGTLSFVVVVSDGTTSHADTVTITVSNNSAPVITSDGGGTTASLSLVENSTAVTTVTATDADADTVTYSISGGLDAAKFSINSSTGELTFVSAPDYAVPADSNGDNVYEVIVQVSDGNGGTDSQTLNVTVTSEEPIGHWTFDADATDSSGNNYDGTLTNGASIDTTDATNIVGAGKLSLDGTNDYVDLTSHLVEFTSLTEGTISAWIKTTSTSGVIFASNDIADTASGTVLWVNSSGQLEFLVFESNVALLQVHTNVTVNDGTWHQVAVTNGTSGNILYIDGVQATVTYTAGNSATDRFFDDVTGEDTLFIGRDQRSGGSLFFNGTIDDVRVYNRVLTGSDVDALFTTSGNHSPVNTVPGAQTVDEDTPLAVSGISVNDTEGNLSTVQLSVSNGTLDVRLSGSATISAGANGRSTLTLSGSQADINASLASLTYQGDLNFNGSDTLTVTSTDTNSATDTDTIAITVTSINDAPVNTVPGAQAVTEDTPLSITGVSVTDVDDNLSTVQLAVTNGTLNVTLSGSATISAGANGTNTLTLSGSQADINATLASLSYQGTLNYTGSDTLTITSTDATSATDVDTVAITVSNVNDAPVNTVPGAQTATEDTPLSISGVSVTDVDDNLSTVQLSVDFGRLTVTLSGSATITAGANNGPTLTLSGSQTDINATLASLVYQGPANYSGSATLTVLSTDANSATDVDTVAITVNPANDAPVLDLDADDSSGATGADYQVTFTENGGAVSLADVADGSLTDVDGGNLVGLTVTLSNPLDGTSEVLTADTTGTSIVAVYDSGTGVLTLSGSDSIANYQQVLRTIQYNNTSEAPDLTNRVLYVVAEDGTDYSNTATVTVSMVGVNDAPVNTVPGAQTATEDTPLALSGISVTDVDDNLSTVQLAVTNGTLNVTLSGAATISAGANGSSTLTLAGSQADINATLASLSYQGTLNYTGSDTLTITSTDATSATDVDTVAITVSSVNDAPSFLVGDGIVTAAFGSGADEGRSVLVQPDGKIVVVGLGQIGPSYDFAIARYNVDGSLDTSFGGGDGKVTTPLALSSSDVAYSVTLQPDGKILVAGEIYQGTTSDFALVRYNADGSLDTTFGGGDGIVTTPIGAGSEDGTSVAVQSDGKILVAGFSDNGTDDDFAVVRYNADGSLDASFGGGDGIVTTSVGLSHDRVSSMQILSDGKILVSGTTVTNGNSDFALVQYNADGTLDTSFGGGDGIVVTAASSGTDQALSLAVQSDGKILVGGYSAVGGSWDFTVVRYNADGTLDTSFSGDGIATAALGAFTDKGTSLVLQADGKVIIVGHVFNGTNYDIGLARFNTDGTLDVSFGGGDGTVTMAVGSGDDYAYDVKVQTDGKIVVSGSTYNGSNDDLLLVRFNPDGSLDTTFDLTTNTLDGTPTYIEDGSAVVLDVDVDISDSELDALNGGTGNYSGASLTLARHGGANAEDVLGFRDGNGITLVGGNLMKNRQVIASFDTTTPGELVLSFTDANGEIPTSADVDNILRQLTYANTSNTPPVSAQIDWTFSDGNSGSQGRGGALTATGSTTVMMTAVNDVPVNTVPGSQTATEDTPLALSGISVTDVDDNLSTVQLAVTNGTLNVTLSGAATISAGANGSSTLTLAGSQADINATLASLSYQGSLNYTGSDMLTITSTDATSATDVDTVAITVVGNNTPPVITSFGGGDSASISLAENLADVAAIAAIDTDGDPITFSISGGADAARFMIDATTGALRFTSSPDYENPMDAGGDNTYDVVVQVTDGQGGTDTQALAISVTDVFEGGIQMPPDLTPEPTPASTQTPTAEPTPDPTLEPTPDSGSRDSTGSSVETNYLLAGPVIDQSLEGGGAEPSVGHALEREVEFGDIRDGQDVLNLPPLLKPSSWATTSDQIRSYYGEPVDIVKSELSSEFLQHLRASSDEIDQAITDQREERSLLVNMAKETGLALSAGFVAWMVRGGALVASLMASLPAWRHFDPIPVLGMDKKDKEAWSRRVKEAATLEAREHRGLEQILRAKHTEPPPSDSDLTTRSGSS